MGLAPSVLGVDIPDSVSIASASAFAVLMSGGATEKETIGDGAADTAADTDSDDDFQ